MRMMRRKIDFLIGSLLFLVMIYVIVSNRSTDMPTALHSRSFFSTSAPAKEDIHYEEPAKRNITFVKPAKRNITCRKPKFANPHLPITALASYPGSGNTWFRHLLQKATGIYTGSVYNDKVLRLGGFPGETHVDGSVIAVKLHDPCRLPTTNPFCLKKYDRAILLFRDARGAGKAEFNRQHSKSNHLGQAKSEELLEGLPGFLEKSLTGWNATNMAWLSIEKPLIMVDYDQLKLDPKKEMSKVFDFLKFPVSEDDLECMLRDSEGKFHRKTNQTMPKLSENYNHKAEQAKEVMWRLYEKRQQQLHGGQ